MTDSLVPPPPPKPDEPGLIEDFVDIFVSPAKVFARRAKAGAGMAFLAVTIALAAILYTGKNAMEPIMEAQTRKAMEAQQRNGNQKLTAEQIDGAVAFQKKLAPFIGVLFAPIGILALAILVWAVGKGFGAEVTYGTSLMITSYAYVPRAIGGIATDIQGLVSDVSRLTNPSQLSFSPARFLDADATNPLVLAGLMRLDILTIWVTVLLAIGLASAGKLPKQKAIWAGVTLWVVGSLFPLWGAFRSM